MLLHFHEEQRVEVLKMYHGALEEGGFIVLGHTQKMPGNLEGMFEQMEKHGQIYKKINK